MEIGGVRMPNGISWVQCGRDDGGPERQGQMGNPDLTMGRGFMVIALALA